MKTDDKEDKYLTSLERECHRCHKVVGVGLAAISGIFFTLCSVTVKLAKHVHPVEVLVFRSFIQLILIMPVMWMVKADPRGPKGSRGMILLHGLVGCLTVMCVFIGFSRLPVGDAATIIFSNPVITIILSFCLLKEHCGIYRIFIVLILLSGVALVAQPPDLLKLLYDNKIIDDNSKPQDVQNLQHYHVAGYIAAICGTFLTATNFVMVRKLKDVHFSVLIFSFSAMSLLISLIVTPLVGTFTLPTSWQEWTYCILVGLCGYFGQVGHHRICFFIFNKLCCSAPILFAFRLSLASITSLCSFINTFFINI